MTRPKFLDALFTAAAGRVCLASLVASATLGAFAPSTAAACSLWAVSDKSAAALITPADLPEALALATVRCDGDERSVAVWTLTVDEDAPFLGVRDAPLFQTSNTGDLKQIAEAGLPGEARVTVFQRANFDTTPVAQGTPAAPYRRFVTFCDAMPEIAAPLDCALRGARAKARATATDEDRDGVLDLVNHEISLYLGGDRLHVVFFSEPYQGAALSGAAGWIDVLASFDLLPPET